MKTRLCILGILFIWAVIAGQAFADDGIIRMSDRQDVTFGKMVADLVQADSIVIGEVHNDAYHHQVQLEIIRALHERKAGVAIGLEVFQTDSQQQLDEWVAGKMSEQDFQTVYSRNWSFDWKLYRDVFIFARDNRIPMIALNIPKQIVSKVARQGFASLTDEEKKNLPPGITCELKSKYTDLLKAAFGQVFKHAVKDSSFTNFCESQTLRNSGMAWNMARYQQKHPDRKVVAIAGVWHAVKGGVPAHLPESGKKTYRVILPEIAELGPNNATVHEADYLVRKQGN